MPALLEPHTAAAPELASSPRATCRKHPHPHGLTDEPLEIRNRLAVIHPRPYRADRGRFVRHPCVTNAEGGSM